MEKRVIVSYIFELISGFGGDGFVPDRLRFSCAETGELYQIELVSLKWQKKTDYIKEDQKVDRDFLYFVQGEDGSKRVLIMQGRKRTIYENVEGRRVITL